VSLVVHKYGGTSLGDAERIKNVARRIAARRAVGDSLVVVVSAMGGSTDRLRDLATQIGGDHPDPREVDILLSTGETVSMTLMAMALHALEVDAISLSGAQAGLRTDTVHGRARILALEPERIRREIERGRVVIVAGFQGITEEAEITTLGRGASDTTAVALAAALGADCCEIYTDVDGVYSADPRLEPAARKLQDISYEEMLELAAVGARVMHPRAVELGSVYGVKIVVASSFNEAPGTLIHGGVTMEAFNKVRGIAHDLDVAKVTIRGVPDRPGIAASIFEPLAQHHVSVDTIVQNASVEQLTDLTFTLDRGHVRQAEPIVERIATEIGAADVVTDEGLGKVSIVGTGMQSAPGYAARMFRTLHEAGVNIEMISTGEIRITCIVRREDVERAVRALHRAFELEKAEATEL
jgi:aspartate kinase